MNAPSRVRRDEIGRFLAKGKTAKGAKAQHLEGEIQSAFAQWCKLCLADDVLWFSIPNEGARPFTQTAALLRMGMRKGASDFLIIYEGRAHFIEFKGPKGNIRPDQRRFLVDVESAGAQIAICRSSEAAIGQVEAWGIPHKDKSRGRPQGHWRSIGDLAKKIVESKK